MSLVVLILLSIVVAVSVLYPQVVGDFLALALMCPVVVYVLVLLVDFGLYSLVQTLLTAFGGILLGVLALIVLLPMSSPSPGRFLNDVWRGGLRALLGTRQGLSGLLHNSLFIFYEELVWRVFLLQTLTQWVSVWAAGLFAASLFWYSHEKNRKLSWASCEFLLFSFFLSFVYVRTQSLILVIGIHLARNVLILAQQLGQQR